MTKETARNINRIIFFLSLLGIAMAVYVLQSFIRQTGIVCVSSGCELVRKSPASYLFGFFPVPAVGLIGYTILAICAFLRTTNLKAVHLTLVTRIMVGMATFGVLFVTWFTYTEIFVIKGVCTWCALSAVNMVVIFTLLVKNHR
ncbi:MAG TPA: vitamin K epoxide reductase family protein [Patescibacteria group bacterium]|nr:vitamin K epoxide reductase family protein [Patescibacteria group bacterium]